jgi:cyclic pyranopterin phosphate synthase
MARHFRERHGGHVVLRFIEFMDVGSTNGWRMDEVLPVGRGGAAHRARPSRIEPIEAAATPGEVGASAGATATAAARSALISSASPRPSAATAPARACPTEGQLFTVPVRLRAGHDLRALLRGGFSDAQIAAAIGLAWQEREDRYSELRHAQAAGPGSGGRRIEMHYIGVETMSESLFDKLGAGASDAPALSAPGRPALT